jgi:decaprenyl-phosphate phosphoribosyltransferase
MPLNPYVAMTRPDYWLKNIFLLPGVAIAYIETDAAALQLFPGMFIGILAACLVASANYVINEFLDADYDRFHPTKRERPAVVLRIPGSLVAIEYAGLILVGFLLGLLINRNFCLTLVLFALCGVAYNVKPIRLKDIVYLDVISESFNNVLRLILGWYIVTESSVPPASLMLSFWMAGAFLMTSKRLSEYRQIGDPLVAGNYRRSFQFYTERSLLLSSVFYAITFAFLFGIFLFKYRIEYILTFPLFSALFVWYLGIAMKHCPDHKDPEHFFKEKWLMLYVLIIVCSIILLSFLDIPILKSALQSEYYR